MLFFAISRNESSDVISDKGMWVWALESMPNRIWSIGMIEAKENRLNIAVMRLSSMLATTYHLYGERKRLKRENILIVNIISY